MNSKFQWAASWVIGTCVFAACGGTPLLPNATGGTVGGPVLGVPTPQPLPNLSVARIDLDQSETGSVFAPKSSSKTSYVRLKLTLANSGGASSPAGMVTIRTFQQYGVVTHTTSKSFQDAIAAHGSITVKVLVPIDRIANGWETGCVFEVKVDPLGIIPETNENDNLSFICGYYGAGFLGQYLSGHEQVIGRGVEGIPLPKPIRDPGFFIPHLISPIRTGPVWL